MNLSATSLNKWRTCPSAWWYDYRARVKQEPSDGMLFGRPLHAVVDTYLQSGEWPDPSTLAHPQADTILSVARLGIEALDRLRALPIQTETKVAIPAGGVLGPLSFKGYVDVHWRDTDTAGVVDHKGVKDSKSPHNRTPETMGREPQTLLYSYALWYTDPPAQVRLAHFLYQRLSPLSFREVWAKEPVPWGAVEEYAAYARETAARMKSAQTVDNVEDIEYKRSGCTAYGGCPHARYCPHVSPPHWSRPMGLMDQIKAAREAATPVSTAPPDAPPAAPPNPAVHVAALEILCALGEDASGAQVMAFYTSDAGQEVVARHGLQLSDVPGLLEAIGDNKGELRKEAARLRAQAQTEVTPVAPVEDSAPVPVAPIIPAVPVPDAAPQEPAGAPAQVPEKFRPVYEVLVRLGGRARNETAEFRETVLATTGNQRWCKAVATYLGEGEDIGLWAVSGQGVVLSGQSAAETLPAAPAVPGPVAAPVPTLGPVEVLVGCHRRGASEIHIDDYLRPVYDRVEDGHNERGRKLCHWLELPYREPAAAVYGSFVALQLPPPEGPLFVPKYHPLVDFLDRMFPTAAITFAA